MLHIGNSAYIKINEVEVIVPPESAPIKKLIHHAQDIEKCVDCTFGNRTKSVIVLKSGTIVLSSTLSRTLNDRYKQLSLGGRRGEKS